MWNGQEPLEDKENLRIEFGTLRQVRPSMDRKNVPPHIAYPAERSRAWLVEVRKVWWAAHSHDLLEKWDEYIHKTCAGTPNQDVCNKSVVFHGS
jgi:hypothetical protein